MKKLLIIKLLFLLNLTYSQDIVNKFDLKKSELTEKLINSNIQTFFFLSKNCSGNIYNFDSNGKNEVTENNIFTAYVFWEENSKVLIQKFDNEGFFNILEIEKSNIFKFLVKHKKRILREKILDYETYYKGKRVVLDIEECLRKFNFIINSEEFENSFYDYKLVKNSHINGTSENINYSKNNSLKIVELLKNCEELLLTIEKEKEFTRIE